MKVVVSYLAENVVLSTCFGIAGNQGCEGHSEATIIPDGFLVIIGNGGNAKKYMYFHLTVKASAVMEFESGNHKK